MQRQMNIVQQDTKFLKMDKRGNNQMRIIETGSLSLVPGTG